MSISLAKKRPLVTLDDFIDTYEEPDHWRRHEAQEFLERKGLLPLRYTNKLLPNLNILVGWLLWSGSISHYSAAISAHDEDQKPIIKAAKPLELGLIKQPDKLTFGKHGLPYSRLCAGLGVYNSCGSREEMDTKTFHQINLPPYILFLAKNFHNIHGPVRKRIRKILEDQCKIILITRLRMPLKCRPYYIESLSNYESKENARNLAKQVITLFNSVYPRIGLDASCIKTGYLQAMDLHYGRIMIRAEHIANALYYHNLFNLSLNKEYTSWLAKS